MPSYCDERRSRWDVVLGWKRLLGSGSMWRDLDVLGAMGCVCWVWFVVGEC